ncbi:MAG: helix-turn-helix domain-containing protein [Clostridia bacterium]|nr:helix-turn-helix domain-containing protein [Clostridia bacterium]
MRIIVGERIKELISDFRINQTQLAKKIGVRQDTVGAWIAGKSEPCIGFLWMIADYFDVDIDYLVGRKEYS